MIPAPTTAQPEAPSADDTAPRVEALLITADRATPAPALAEALGLIGPEDGGPARSAAAAEVEAAIASLNTAYEATGRSFRIERVAGGYRVMTLARFGPTLNGARGARSGRLSRPAIETLAIVAYRQPLTRAQIEAIRGVGCGEVLRALLERRLVTITGRAEELGRPMLYGTTRRFLEVFGLASLDDLPSAKDLGDRV